MNNNSLLCLCENILNEREKKIFIMYFGIHCRPMNFEEIANEFGVTRERIKQIANKALSKIGEADREIWDRIFQKAKNGFLLKEGIHTFDPELDDLTMAKICHSIYGKRCIVFRNKELRHAWLTDYETKENSIEFINSIRKHREKSPINPGIEQILSYCNGDIDFDRKLLEDFYCFNKDDRTLTSLMPLENRLEYLLEKSNGVVTIQEIMDIFNIDRNKAHRLIKEGPCFTIGKTLCYSYRTNNILIQLIKALDYAEKPLSIEENCLYTIGIEFGLSKQETIDAINSLVDSSPDIFTRIDDKIALLEWYIKRKSVIHKKHEKRLIDTIIEVIDKSEIPVSSTEISELLKQKYGKLVSSNLNSIRMYLNQLYKMGEIGRIGTKNEYKYFLPKP